MGDASDLFVGIDLGTTNSSVAVVRDGQPRLILVDGDVLVPSVVGMASDGSTLVGHTARNQSVLYPERTVRSVKRRMGEETMLPMGDQEFSPVEVAALIIRRLTTAAAADLGRDIRRAVITVPAYFSDAQRTATREAGEVAGLEVVRILNEPTSAALCYADGEDFDRTVMVYDLGGGTFDVSIVRQRGDVTEVLASHGNTALGGDDFDAALLEWLRESFEEKHDLSLEGNLVALSRLVRASESAKIALSTDSFASISEEHLAERGGVSLHLEGEVSRHEYQELIRPYVERTKDSVQTALREAGLLAREIDELILVGGSTRTPMVAEMLRSQLDLPPRMDVTPEHAVALGAALHAARLGGDATGRILVDVTPFTFGTSYFGLHDGESYDACFKGIIKRNTPLPTRQTEVFYTMVDGQQRVDATIYQGEATDARDNLLIGRFMVDGLDPSVPSGSAILFNLKLNVDGILEVEVIEKHTGLRKALVIEDAFRKLSPEELEVARQRIRQLWKPEELVEGEERDQSGAVMDQGTGQSPASGNEPPGLDVPPAPEGLAPEQRQMWAKAVSLIEKAHRVSQDLDGADATEVDEVLGSLRNGLESGDFGVIEERSDELADILFYLE